MASEHQGNEKNILMRSKRYADISAGNLRGKDNYGTSQCGAMCRCGEELPPPSLLPSLSPSHPPWVDEGKLVLFTLEDMTLISPPRLISATFTPKQRKPLRKHLAAHKYQVKCEENWVDWVETVFPFSAPGSAPGTL